MLGRAALLGRTMAESKCRSCGALVLWVKMAPSCRWTPLDPVPSATGNIERKRGKVSDRWYGRVVPESERHNHGPLYVSHFATCPQADNWRRPEA